MAQILCPNCRTNSVSAVGWNFSQTSVEVPVCGTCQVTGLVAIKVRVTAMADLELPAYTVRHRDGLLEFAA